jgi:hypothetical protein
MWMALLDSMRFKLALRAMVILSLIFAIGCGGNGSQPSYADLGLVEISGTIRLDGTPLANAYVQFEDEDGSFSYSDADSQGRYRLRFDSKTYGTVPGKKVVRVRMGTLNAEEAATDSEDPDAKPASMASSPIKIPACYNQQSILVKQVTGAESNVDFDLKSEGVARIAP